MRHDWIAAIIALVTLTAGCAGPQSQSLRIGGTTGVTTRGDLRLVTERPDPHPALGLYDHKVLCAEPSPDVALALSTTLSLQASAKTAGTDATGSASHAATEAVTALAGRTAAVMALRDGLFRACEAYANGVVGRDAYGLILSQYGDLLVTLMLGEDAAEAAKTGVGVATPGAPGGSEAVVAIARGYLDAADARRHAALLVLCTLAAERVREALGQKAGPAPFDLTDPRCGGVTPPASAR